MVSFFRRKYLIYPRFQLSLLALDVVLLGSFFAASLFAVNRSYSYLLNQGKDLGLTPQHPYFHFLDTQFGLIYRSISISFGVCLVLSSVLMVLLSHRLAGPVVRMKSFFNEISRNGLSGYKPLKFRKGDFLSDLPEAVNAALEKLNR